MNKYGTFKWTFVVCPVEKVAIAASPISLLSMGGVCGRSLMAGKILFTGRQTCSLYLVLWLCDPIVYTNINLMVAVIVWLP